LWLLKKVIDLILYGNFWIAFGALALTAQTQFILGHPLEWNPLLGFVFCATWLLYALHRIVGILQLTEFLEVERFRVIAQFRHHIIAYAVIAGIGTIWYFFQLPLRVQFTSVIPSLFSLSYVLPVFGRKRRLRDFDQIKIYLVAFTWAWVTVALPVVYWDANAIGTCSLMFLERMLFIFAITLPFDIRDLQVDGQTKVQTLPAILDIKKIFQLAKGLLITALILVGVNFGLGFYSWQITTALSLSLFSTMFLIPLSNTERHDYFYSGLMDGTIILQGVLIGVFGLI
jgi:4-hydroxybenzoate polyprenyltransferase